MCLGRFLLLLCCFLDRGCDDLVCLVCLSICSLIGSWLLLTSLFCSLSVDTVGFLSSHSPTFTDSLCRVLCCTYVLYSCWMLDWLLAWRWIVGYSLSGSIFVVFCVVACLCSVSVACLPVACWFSLHPIATVYVQYQIISYHTIRTVCT